MQNKTIAVVYNTSWYIYNFRLNLIKSLQKEGYNIICIAPRDEYTIKLEECGCIHYDIKIDGKGKSFVNDFKTLFSFYKIYKKTKPDLLLQYTIKPNVYGTLAAGLLKIPTINNIAGLGTLFIENTLMTKLAKFLYYISQKKATKVFFQNIDDLKLFTETNNLVDKMKSDLLPGSGVDLKKFSPVKKTNNLKNNDNVFKFILIARILWAKGIGEYVEAAKIINAKYKGLAEFQLLGFLDETIPNGISKNLVNTWMETGAIKYLGKTDNVKDYLREVDCIVLPSFYREGVPRTLLEASAMGLPIITTNNVGCKETVVDGVNGYLCKIKDSNDLANQMEKMINLSKKELKDMGQKSREMAETKFDEKIVIDKYLNVIKEIMSNIKE